MSWLSVLIQLPTQLAELIRLQREQNALLREAIRSATGRDPLTPSTPLRPPTRRKLTVQDLTYNTRASLATFQRQERERLHHQQLRGEAPAPVAPPTADDSPAP